MNQIKIGKFIAECRKKNNLTQMQLAEKLNITNRAISKWENGKGMPDSSIMLDLCNELKISVNELLSGEMINMENKNEKQEQLLLNIAKEIEEKNKIIWTSMWAILIIAIIALLAGITIVAFLVPEGIWQFVAILSLCIIFLPLCFYALKLEISVGCYKCKNCGQEIIPTYSEALWAMHMGTTRYLKCPKCNKRYWFKKVIKK